MSELNDILKSTGNDAKELVKQQLIDLIDTAKNDAEAVAKETAIKVEKWVKMCAIGEIDDHELEALLNARRRTVRQFLNTQEITTKARLENLIMGLIDIVLNKAMGLLF